MRCELHVPYGSKCAITRVFIFFIQTKCLATFETFMLQRLVNFSYFTIHACRAAGREIRKWIESSKRVELNKHASLTLGLTILYIL